MSRLELREFRYLSLAAGNWLQRLNSRQKLYNLFSMPGSDISVSLSSSFHVYLSAVLLVPY